MIITKITVQAATNLVAEFMKIKKQKDIKVVLPKRLVIQQMNSYMKMIKYWQNLCYPTKDKVDHKMPCNQIVELSN